MAEKKKQARFVGMVALIVLVMMAGFAYWTGTRQARQAKADFALAEEAIIASIQAGGSPVAGACADLAGRAREAIARQMRRGGLKKMFVNRKAVVYDLVLQGALAVCLGEPTPIYEKFNGCSDAGTCRSEAVVALLSGNTNAASEAVAAAISYQEDDTLRELQKLIQSISTSIQ